MNNAIASLYLIATFVLTVLAVVGIVSVPGLLIALLWAPIALSTLVLLGALALTLWAASRG